MNKIIALTLLAALPIMAQSHHHCGTPMPPYNHYAAHHHGKPMMPPHGGHQPGKPVTPPNGTPGVQQPDKPATPPNQVIPSRRILPIVPGNSGTGGNTVSGGKKITVPNTTHSGPDDPRLRELLQRTGSIRY